MLAALDQGPGAPPAPRAEGTSATYTLGSGPHFYVVVVPNRGNDLNQIKTSISNFGAQYVPTETLQITNSFLDAERQVILVDRLGSKESAMNYHRLFTGNSDVLGDLNNKGFTTFAISPENYTLLYKSKDIAGYTEFFLKNYVEAQ
jgi:hypothetical protein